MAWFSAGVCQNAPMLIRGSTILLFYLWAVAFAIVSGADGAFVGEQ